LTSLLRLFRPLEVSDHRGFVDISQEWYH
jgi:hypothetical protein